jgi:RNA polymerase sigma factor (sigma-70 family)
VTAHSTRAQTRAADGCARDRNDELVRALPDYRRWLFRVAYDLSPVGSSDVEDLVQEGYIAMWRALGTYDPKQGALPTWITNAARMRMKDVAFGSGQFFGRPETRGARSVEATVSTDALVEDNPAALDMLLDFSDLAESATFAYHAGEIAEAIDRLSPAQRRYVIARFWLGLDGTARSPELRRLCALVPELRRGSSLWLGTSDQRGARDRLAADLAHLAVLVVAA